MGSDPRTPALTCRITEPLADPDVDADHWAAFLSTVTRWTVDGAATFSRDGVPLDVGTIRQLEPGDFVGLTIDVHDPRLAATVVMVVASRG